MTKDEIRRQVTRDTLLETKRLTGQGFVPAAVSARHVHLDRGAVDALFGKGYRLTQLRPLSQPGQYACRETVAVEGPKGRLATVRVLGPERKETQVEISVTDARQIGLQPVAHMSGEVVGTPGARLIGPAGQLVIPQGVMVAARHFHISPAQAAVYGLANGDVVRLRTGGPRSIVFEEVLVRCGEGHDLEVHLDFDEANCAMIGNGDLLEIL